MSTPPDPLVRAFAEFRVGFVIAHSAVLAGEAGGRLDAVERTLSSLVRRWRMGERLSPARDIRISPATLDEVIDWVTRASRPDAQATARLGVYHSGAVTDVSVPSGWIRVYLGTEQHRRSA